jgi:hypothetical protein
VTGTVNLSTHITDVVAALEAEQAAISPTAAVILALSANQLALSAICPM